MAGPGGIQPALGGGEVLPCLGTAWNLGARGGKEGMARSTPMPDLMPHVSLCLRHPDKRNDGGAEQGALPDRVDSQA